MTGKIYGIGVGPGDPELMTLKAVRLIQKADVLAIPGKDRESCVAFRIASQAVEGLDEKEILPIDFPMTKDKKVLEDSHESAVRALASMLLNGKNVAFLTLGDPTVYSTYLYVHKRLEAMGFDAEIINGIPSFCAAAARLSVGLGERSESIHILPASYPVADGLALSGTKVLMKSGKQIGNLKKLLMETKCEVQMVENCGMDGERVIRNAEDIPEDAGYYSLVIVKDREEAGSEGE